MFGAFFVVVGLVLVFVWIGGGLFLFVGFGFIYMGISRC